MNDGIECARWREELLAGTLRVPEVVEQLEIETQELGFGMASDRETGAVLRFLASRCSSGRVLELGTGTGISAAWILTGLGPGGCLRSIDNDPAVSAVAERRLGEDSRVEFIVGDAATEIGDLTARGQRFDLIFADAWPGKYSLLEDGLGLLADGGAYLLDDLLPQENWPSGHEREVRRLLQELDRPDLNCTPLTGATGLLLVERRSS